MTARQFPTAIPSFVLAGLMLLLGLAALSPTPAAAETAAAGATAAETAPADATAPETAASGSSGDGSAASTTTAPEPQANLAELEDEIMCPICGTLLGLAEAPQADRQRALIRRLIDEGRTKEEIKDVLVAEYGPEVLAMPERSGFSLTAYLVPIVGFTLALALLSVAVWRWRKAAAASEGSDPPRSGSDGNGTGPQPHGPSGAEAERLDADLARYDL